MNISTQNSNIDNTLYFNSTSIQKKTANENNQQISSISTQALANQPKISRIQSVKIRILNLFQTEPSTFDPLKSSNADNQVIQATNNMNLDFDDLGSLDLVDSQYDQILYPTSSHQLEEEALKTDLLSKNHFDHVIEEETTYSEELAKKVDSLADASFEMIQEEPKPRLLAQGKAKAVYVKHDDPSYVYYIPVTESFMSVFGSKMKEIKDEVDLSRHLKAKLPEDAMNYLVMDLDEVSAAESINNAYTVKASKAEGDLEKLLREGVDDRYPLFPESIILLQQLAKGLAYLHQAGSVHGDIKFDNVLVFKNKEGQWALKFADFGKSKILNEHENRMYTGNTRFMAPESRLSQKGESFSLAMLMIGILEREFLDEKEENMLIQDFPRDLEAVIHSKRAGIEKFVILNSLCIQRDTISLSDKAKTITGNLFNLTPSPSRLRENEKEIHRYIQKLTEKLIEKYGSEDKAKLTFLALQNILLGMTKGDSKTRLSTLEINDLISNLDFN